MTRPAAAAALGPDATQLHFHGAISGLVSERELFGRPHLVAPVVMVREMVLDQGDHGELLPAETIEESVSKQLWEGRPVTIRHPTGRDGSFVSAGLPEVADEVEIGSIRNVEIDESGSTVRLRGEAWIDVAQAERLDEGAEIVERLRQFTDAERHPGIVPFEVSTGYWASLDPSEGGVFRGARFRGVQRDMVPDHLAVLPDQRGKCSIEDGCGLPRLNARGRPVVPATLDDGEIETNVLSEARRPSFSDAVPGAVPDGWPPSLEDFVVARGWDAGTWGDLSAEQQDEIVATTLLGEPADTFSASMVFPVVDVDGGLRENALVAVLGGRGAQADVPEGALESARTRARSLLESEFDREIEENADATTAERVVRAVADFLGLDRWRRERAQDGQSLDAIRDAVRDAIEEREGGPNRWTHVVELFEGSVVFAVDPQGGPEQLWMADYEIGGDGTATLGEPEPVRRRVEYEPVANDDGSGDGDSDHRGDDTMLNDEQRAAIVAALVACEACPYDEEMLANFEDADLVTIARSREVNVEGLDLNQLGSDDGGGEPGSAAAGDEPASASAAEGGGDGGGTGGDEPAPVEVSAATVANALGIPEDELPEMVDAWRAASEERRRTREEIIDALVENEACRLTRDALESIGTPALEDLAKSFESRNYALRGGPRGGGWGGRKSEGESYFDRHPRTPGVVTRNVGRKRRTEKDGDDD